MTWAQESHKIATEGEGAYSGVTVGDPVPQEYLDNYLPKQQEHIVKGGKRLYHVIKTIFANKEEEKTETFLQWVEI